MKKCDCQDCVCLVAGDNGEWVCDEMNKPIEEVENCPEQVDGKVYLTHYCEYPIYEPAEGGYYYAGREACESYECDTEDEAIQQFEDMKAELEGDGFIIREDLYQAYLPSKYIGEGEMWIIEKTYGSRESGKQIYQ